jgi:hypothetical protein
MRALQVAYDEAQGELKNLEVAALEVCQELEGSRVNVTNQKFRCENLRNFDKLFVWN